MAVRGLLPKHQEAGRPLADHAEIVPLNHLLVIGGAATAVAIALGGLLQPAAPGIKLIPSICLFVTVVILMSFERSRYGLQAFSPYIFTSVAYLFMFAGVPILDVVFANPISAHTAWWPAGWLAWAGFILLWTGYRGVHCLGALDRQRRPIGTWSPRVAVVAGVLFLGTGLLGVLLWVGGPDGVAQYFSNFAKRHELIRGSGSSVLIAISLAGPAALLLAGNCLRRPTAMRILAFLAVWLPACLVVAGFMGQRWRAASILVGVVALYHLGYRRLRTSLLLLMCVVLVLALIAWGFQRNLVGTPNSAPSLSGLNFYYNYLGRTHEAGQFRNFVITVEGVPDRLDFQYGQTFLSVIPGTPFPTGGFLFSSTFYGRLYQAGTSVPTPLPGELYLNFGVAGIVVGLALFGAALGVLERYYQRNRGRIGPLLVYSYSLLPLALILRGDFTTFAGYYLVGLVPLLGATWLAERAVERAHDRPA
jgi:oligosaccharide repeat unit polymerase